MEKLNFVKEYPNYYTATSAPRLIELSPIRYLTIEGKGEPAGVIFINATTSLYQLAYGVKKINKDLGSDFTVPKLEGIWWVLSSLPALEVPREEWYWKLMIRMPDFVTNEHVENARGLLIAKKKSDHISCVKMESIEEGTCLQMLHIGPYTTEPQTLAIMHDFMEANDLVQNGLHHEIYLSDPRKVPPEKCKTILRLPVIDRIVATDQFGL
nr:GyrI-like domain-containing protein [Shimazuella kribbensis]